MQRELKADVPQVFEPGARVRGHRTGNVYVLDRVDGESWFGWVASGECLPIVYENEAAQHLTVIAPAPRAGQRWACSACTVSLGSFDDVVSKARWLLSHGLRYVGEALEPAGAPPPVGSLEPMAPPRSPAEPTPWTREDARRAILDAIRSESPLHRDAFTSALCSMAEFLVPGERMILVRASALCAAEETMPERGAIATWQEELAARAMREVLERAYGKANAPLLCVDACARYLERRAGR